MAAGHPRWPDDPSVMASVRPRSGAGTGAPAPCGGLGHHRPFGYR